MFTAHVLAVGGRYLLEYAPLHGGGHTGAPFLPGKSVQRHHGDIVGIAYDCISPRVAQAAVSGLVRGCRRGLPGQFARAARVLIDGPAG
jgi:hypothetical protein